MVALKVRVNTQTNQLFDAWCLKVIGLSRVTKKLYQVGAKKAVICSRLLFFMKHHQDLKLLVSRWSTDSHASWLPRRTTPLL